MGNLVGESMTWTATYWPSMRKSFYAAGRFWVFYSNSTNMVYCTSTDGINWTAPTTIRACNSGVKFSIWFDETLSFLHYAYSHGEPNRHLYYRRGTPNSNGSITWSADEQIAVVAGAADYIHYPIVTVDSDGYAWISYSHTIFTDVYTSVTKSLNTTGIWATDIGSGFPYQLVTGVRVILISVIPLTGGEMLAIYAGFNIPVKARLWNGIAWEVETSTSSAIRESKYFSAVAKGNDVPLVFTNSSKRLTYAKYDHSSNSFTDEKFLTGTFLVAPPVISIDKDNNLLVFWANYPSWNTLYYLKYTAENDTWGPVVKWKTETATILYNSITCFYKKYLGYTGLMYTTNGIGLPLHKVKFNYIGPLLPSGITPAPTLEPEVVSNTLTSGGSRHITPEEGSVGTSLSVKSTRISRHITWVPVVITRA